MATTAGKATIDVGFTGAAARALALQLALEAAPKIYVTPSETEFVAVATKFEAYLRGDPAEPPAETPKGADDRTKDWEVVENDLARRIRDTLALATGSGSTPSARARHTAVQIMADYTLTPRGTYSDTAAEPLDPAEATGKEIADLILARMGGYGGATDHARKTAIEIQRNYQLIRRNRNTNQKEPQP